MSRGTTLSGTEAGPLSDADPPWRRFQNTDVPPVPSRGRYPWPGIRRRGRGAARPPAGSHQDHHAGQTAPPPRVGSSRRSSAHRLDEGACPDDATVRALGRAYAGSPVHPGIARVDYAGRGFKEAPVAASAPADYRTLAGARGPCHRRDGPRRDPRISDRAGRGSARRGRSCSALIRSQAGAREACRHWQAGDRPRCRAAHR